MRDRTGFSLVELLVSISVIALIVGVALPNLLNARQRARDSKRKSEVAQLRTALRLYYNDYNRYPPAANCGSGKLNYISGCGAISAPNTYPASCCPASGCGADFSGGVNACDTIYMKNFSSDLGSRMYYRLAPSGADDYCISVTLENAGDTDTQTSCTRCSTACAVANCSTSTTYYGCGD